MPYGDDGLVSHISHVSLGVHSLLRICFRLDSSAVLVGESVRPRRGVSRVSKSLLRLLLRLSLCVTSGYRRFLSFSMINHTVMSPNVKHELSGRCRYLAELSTGQRNSLPYRI